MRTVRPLALAGATAFAVLFACLCTLPSTAFVLLAGILLGISILIGIVNRRLNGKLAVLFIVVLTAALALARIALAWAIQQPVQQLADEQPHTVTASVLDVEDGLYQNVYGAKLRVTAVDGQKCRPFLTVCQDMQDPQIGQLLQGEVVFSPSEGNALLRLLARGVSNRCLQQNTTGLAVQGQASGLRIYFNQLRHNLGNRFLLLGRRQGGIAAAMVVGDKTRLDNGSQTLFRNAGIGHLLVISGLHLTMMVTVFALLLRQIIGFRAGNAGSCILVVLIMLLTGLTPSVVRAGVMTILTLMAPVLLQKQDAFTSLGIAMLLLIGANPFSVCDTGLQLSFAATLGAICFQTVTTGHGKKESCLPTFLRRFLQAIALPLFITFFTLPVIALQGGSVGFATLACNVVCIPFMSVLLCAGLVFLLSHCILGTGGLLISGRLLSGLLSGMEWFSQKALQWLPRRVGVSGGWLAFTVVCSMLVAVVWYRSHLKKWFLLTGVGLLVVGIGLSSLLNAGCVSVAPVGDSTNPAVVISCNGECGVIFRGKRTNLQSIQDYMEKHTLSNPRVVISLSEQDFAAEIEQTLGRLDWQPGQADGMFDELPGLETVELAVISQKEGYLALIGIQNYTVGVCSGKVDCSNYPVINAFVAGISVPDGLQTDLLFGIRLPKWLSNVQVERCATAKEICLWLRPGKAVRVSHSVEIGKNFV